MEPKQNKNPQKTKMRFLCLPTIRPLDGDTYICSCSNVCKRGYCPNQCVGNHCDSFGCGTFNCPTHSCDTFNCVSY